MKDKKRKQNGTNNGTTYFYWKSYYSNSRQKLTVRVGLCESGDVFFWLLYLESVFLSVAYLYS